MQIYLVKILLLLYPQYFRDKGTLDYNASELYLVETEHIEHIGKILYLNQMFRNIKDNIVTRLF